MSDSLAILSAEILAFRDERDWAQFHSLRNLATAIGIEVAELQELLLWKTDEEVATLISQEDQRAKIEAEIADILIYSLLLAARVSADPANIVRAKLQANSEKYPVDKARGRSTKYTEL
jgi:NTP pyrophosphatase (non-canonical NTP hydrolase)